MKLIIGLGNPGKQYMNTWHNAGFLAVEQIQKELDFSDFKKDAKLQAELSEGKIGREKIILAKPQTFMNLSGQSVAAILNYYKLTKEDLIVIHDDLDLPLGKIRLTKSSSAGGHNGVKSIIENLGGQNFIRLKIGVHTDLRAKMETADYVLTRPGKDEQKTLKEIIKNTAPAIEAVVRESVESAMNQFN